MSEDQVPLSSWTKRQACSYDTTFDIVDSDNSGAITLAEYLVWVYDYDLKALGNATVLDVWINYFHRYVITLKLMHQPLQIVNLY
jgi:hypothetical protein